MTENYRPTYTCDCGCNIEFISFSMGWDMHYIHNGECINFIFSESSMTNDSWSNYIDMDDFDTWGDLWTYILENHNAQLTNTQVFGNGNYSNIMLHLYNQYVNSPVPMDAVLSLDYIN